MQPSWPRPSTTRSASRTARAAASLSGEKQLLGSSLLTSSLWLALAPAPVPAFPCLSQQAADHMAIITPSLHLQVLEDPRRHQLPSPRCSGAPLRTSPSQGQGKEAATARSPPCQKGQASPSSQKGQAPSPSQENEAATSPKEAGWKTFLKVLRLLSVRCSACLTRLPQQLGGAKSCGLG